VLHAREDSNALRHTQDASADDDWGPRWTVCVRQTPVCRPDRVRDCRPKSRCCQPFGRLRGLQSQSAAQRCQTVPWTRDQGWATAAQRPYAINELHQPVQVFAIRVIEERRMVVARTVPRGSQVMSRGLFFKFACMVASIDLPRSHCKAPYQAPPVAPESGRPGRIPRRVGG